MGRTVIATDNFNRASLGTDWTQINPTFGNIVIVSSIVAGATSEIGDITNSPTARWDGAGTFTDDQYAKALVYALGNYGSAYTMGVIARASADVDANRDFYYFIIRSDSAGPNYTTELGKIVNGTRTSLNSASVAWTPGTDTIEIECEGTTIRGMKSGVLVSGFSVTDSSLTSGKPGILGGYSGGTILNLDDFEGGNITAGATRGGPFGTRGTAFNGGKTFQGILR